MLLLLLPVSTVFFIDFDRYFSYFYWPLAEPLAHAHEILRFRRTAVENHCCELSLLYCSPFFIVRGLAVALMLICLRCRSVTCSWRTSRLSAAIRSTATSCAACVTSSASVPNSPLLPTTSQPLWQITCCLKPRVWCTFSFARGALAALHAKQWYELICNGSRNSCRPVAREN